MAVTGRLYRAGFQKVSLVTSVQDLVLIQTGASKLIGIQQINIGQVGGVTTANLSLRLRYLPSTVTAGTGGSACTAGGATYSINPQNPGDLAATVTARCVDSTTQASTSGTALDQWAEVWNTINGYAWYPGVNNRPTIIPQSGAFVLSLDTAPPSGFVASVSVLFEELP